MKTKPQTQAKAAPIGSSATSAQGVFLQRKCACGGSAGSAGNCEACQKKRPALQRYAADRGASSDLMDSFAEPSNSGSWGAGDAHFGHNFSAVGIHNGAESAHELQRRNSHGYSATGKSYDTQAVLVQLGSGQPFSGSPRSRMESVFQRDFSSVRVHTDANAAQLSQQYNAQAFTIGNHIAFASGQYRPGTPVGDALLAHELAHVTQQSNAKASSLAMQSEGAEYDALERDADASATSAVISLWGRAKGFATGVAQEAMPRLKSGLRLSRCPPPSMNCDKKKVEGATTCDQVCDAAYKESDCNSGGGGVICNGATKCACVFDIPVGAGIKRGECPEIDRIAKIHEERHLTDVDCNSSKGLHRPPFKDPSKATSSECTHRKETSALLTEAMKKATDPCKTKMGDLRSVLDTWVKANCGGS